MVSSSDPLVNDYGVSIQWILRPKRVRKGMFEEENSDTLGQIVAEFQKTPLEAKGSGQTSSITSKIGGLGAFFLALISPESEVISQ